MPHPLSAELYLHAGALEAGYATPHNVAEALRQASDALDAYHEAEESQRAETYDLGGEVEVHWNAEIGAWMHDYSLSPEGQNPNVYLSPGSQYASPMDAAIAECERLRSLLTAARAAAVPGGWIPVCLEHEDGREVWLRSDGCWMMQRDAGSRCHQTIAGVDPLDWQGALRKADELGQPPREGLGQTKEGETHGEGTVGR